VYDSGFGGGAVAPPSVAVKVDDSVEIVRGKGGGGGSGGSGGGREGEEALCCTAAALVL
jgi:hypothetical protein